MCANPIPGADVTCLSKIPRTVTITADSWALNWPLSSANHARSTSCHAGHVRTGSPASDPRREKIAPGGSLPTEGGTLGLAHNAVIAVDHDHAHRRTQLSADAACVMLERPSGFLRERNLVPSERTVRSPSLCVGLNRNCVEQSRFQMGSRCLGESSGCVGK